MCAQFELHALVELASHVESQDFVGISFVAEPKKSVEKYLSQHAQRLQASRQRLSVRSLPCPACAVPLQHRLCGTRS